MSIQKQMTKAEREEARKRREQLKDAPKKMRSGSFKLPSMDRLRKQMNDNRSNKPSKPSKPDKKVKKNKKDKLKIGG